MDCAVDAPPFPRRFRTTRWSLVLSVGKADSEASRAALEDLCRIYWWPLYAWLRARRLGEDESRDLIQGFFARLLERRDLESVTPEKGRLRSFLLASLRHYLADVGDREGSRKRRAQREAVPLDEAPEGWAPPAPAGASPLRVYEREWALRVMGRALDRLRREAIDRGDAERFESLKVYLTGRQAEPAQEETARRLGLSVGALRTALYRLRRSYGEALRAEISETVVDREDVDEELRHLLRAFDG